MERIVILSDEQARYHDQRTLDAVFEFVGDFKPDMLVHNGDLFDLEALSNYRKVPEAKQSVAADLGAGRKILHTSRTVLPHARIVLVEGNHEERVTRYVLDNAEELYGLPLTNVETFLLGDNPDHIEYVGPYGEGLDWHGVLIYHGAHVRKDSGVTAHVEYGDAGTSGVSGHTHRLGSYYHTDRSGSHAWYETGCLCNTSGPNVPPSERGPRVQNWQQGFTYGWADARGWTLLQVPIVGHSFIVGRRYG